MERWKVIQGSKGDYKVSNYGHVKSFKKDKVDGKLLKVSCRNDKEYVTIMVDGKPCKRYIYMLMGKYFPGEHYKDFKSKF